MSHRPFATGLLYLVERVNEPLPLMVAEDAAACAGILPTCHNDRMRVAYLDCFAGISGDMFLGALLDAGVEVRVLEEATAAMGLGASLRIRKVDRCGITSTKVDVMKDGRRAEAAGRPRHGRTGG